MKNLLTGYDPDAIEVFEYDHPTRGKYAEINPNKWVLTTDEFKSFRAPILGAYYVQQRIYSESIVYIIGHDSAIHFMLPTVDSPIIIFWLRKGDKIKSPCELWKPDTTATPPQ